MSKKKIEPEVEAEIIHIPTSLMNKYLDDGDSLDRSIMEHYESKLLMTLMLCKRKVIKDIFSLHYSGEYKECMECSRVSDDFIPWPCLTARTLGLHLGVTEPEEYEQETKYVENMEPWSPPDNDVG